MFGLQSPVFLASMLIVLVINLSGWPRAAYAGVEDCGELKNFGEIGPWDYADPSSSVPTGADPMGRIKRVENVHFHPEMKNLNTKMYSIDKLTAEIHYTLRVFPNHPDALNSMSRLEKQAGGKLPQSSATIFTPRLSAHCFFDRAIRFRPEDKKVHLVYAMHLHRNGKLKEALGQYELAEKLGEDSSSFNYSFGLLYADLKNWEKAFEYAQKAYSSGLDLPGLRQKLERAGYKVESPVRNQKVPEQQTEVAPKQTKAESE